MGRSSEAGERSEEDVVTMRDDRQRMGLGVVGRALILAIAAAFVSSLPASAATAKTVFSGPRSSGAVALTFDDGWNSSACSSISKTLRANNVTGMFFVNGNHLKNAPAKWRRILKKQQIGNHTRSHHNLVTSSDRVVRKQIRENEAVHERILGRQMLKVLRPPYGAHDYSVRRIAGELGYEHIVMWSVDSRDWRKSASVSSVIKRATGARPGSIILMHCARNVTPKALPSIIRHYRARGIKLVGLGKLLDLPRERDLIEGAALEAQLQKQVDIDPPANVADVADARVLADESAHSGPAIREYMTIERLLSAWLRHPDLEGTIPPVPGAAVDVGYDAS